MKNYKAKTLILIVALAAVLITGCDPSRKWAKKERQEIQDYLSSIGDTVYEKKPSGLYYLELIAGSGTSPVVKDTVSVKYKATYLDGKLLGTNFNDTTLFSWIVGSGAALEGLDEGVRYMKQGGKAKLLLPSSLAYGASGIYGVIAGYTPLLFEVYLEKVKPAK